MKKKTFEILRIALIILLAVSVLIKYNEYKNLIKINSNLKKELYKKEIIEKDSDITNIKEKREKNENLKNILLEKYNTSNIENIKDIFKNVNTESDNLVTKISNSKKEIEDLENKKKELNNQYQLLKKKQEEEIKRKKDLLVENYMINNITKYNQYPSYPTGCESVALYILLRYYNIELTVNNIIDKLDKGALPYIENGIRYGGNPYVEFVGNPLSNSGYGTYDYSISKVANQFKGGIINGSGKSLNEVLEIVKQNRPVIVWTSMNLSLPYISDSWKYKPTGENINWLANEHAVVVIGYTNDSIIISDPIGGIIKYQNRNLFEQRYNYYGKRNLYY